MRRTPTSLPIPTPSSCALCGQSSRSEEVVDPSKSCSQYLGKPCSSCIRLLEVEQRVIEAQHTLELVLEERRQLREEANQVHDPFTVRFPLEIACRIFGLYVVPTQTLDDYPTHEGDGINNIEPQFTLGAVCRGWRNILWSTPRFWNEISISFSISTSPSFIPLLKQWLDRSGQLPLTVGLSFKSKIGRPEDLAALALLMDPLIHALNPFTHRMLVLRARIPHVYLQRLQCSTSCKSLLQGLILQPPNCELGAFPFKCDGVFDFGVNVSPKRLSIKRYFTNDVHIQWSNLTHFAGEFITVAEILDLFQKVPNLKVCSLEEIQSLSVNLSPTLPAGPIILPCLTSLTLGQCPQEVLGWLTCPNLQNLRYHLLEEKFSQGTAQFIQRSECSLESAMFICTKADDDDLIELLRLTPHLQELSLVSTPVGETFFNYLGQTAWKQDNVYMAFLPKLELFEYSNRRTFPWSAIPAMAPLSLSPHRIGRPLDTIHFSLLNSGEDLIPRDPLEQILKIINSGVSLDIRNSREEDLIRRSTNFHGLKYSRPFDMDM